MVSAPFAVLHKKEGQRAKMEHFIMQKASGIWFYRKKIRFLCIALIYISGSCSQKHSDSDVEISIKGNVPGLDRYYTVYFRNEGSNEFCVPINELMYEGGFLAINNIKNEVSVTRETLLTKNGMDVSGGFYMIPPNSSRIIPFEIKGIPENIDIETLDLTVRYMTCSEMFSKNSGSMRIKKVRWTGRDELR